MKNRLGWPMATLAILTFSFGSATAAAGALTPKAAPSAVTAAAVPGDPVCGQAPTSIAPTFFTDSVGQPAVAKTDSANHYTLSAHKDSHVFNSTWSAVPTLGYDALGPDGTVATGAHMDYLGPTIPTKQGTPTNVTIKNDLPQAGTQMFPSFRGTPLADGTATSMPTENSTVLHRHGGLQAAADDGTPDQKVLPGGTRTNYYPNNQAAAPLWYHDHADAVTSWNVYAGLAGFMPNTDTLEPQYNLPKGEFSKAYVLQDKSFDPITHELCYSHESPEFFGDVPVINGTIAPTQAVQARRYSFTFINGSDSRFYNLSLTRTDGLPNAAAPQMTVVGSDSGFVLKPAKVKTLLIATGERYTVVVDFTGTTGNWVLHNDAATPYPGGDPNVAKVPSLMRFDVSNIVGLDKSWISPVIAESNNQVPAAVQLLTARLRTVQAGEITAGMPQLGNSTSLLKWTTDATNPVTEKPYLGSTEAWAMRNHSPDSHPIHEHLTELRLVGRWHVDAWGYKDAAGNTLAGQDPVTGTAFPVTIGKFEAPGAWESGPKDTFVAPPDYITVWVGKYTIAGLSVWHCHILSHEDMMAMLGDGTMADGMMRPLEVQSTTPQTQLPWIGNQFNLDKLVRVQDAS